MSKREIIIIIIAVISTIVTADLWTELKRKNDEIVSFGEKYNQAQVIIKNQLDKIDALDRKLAKKLNSKRPKEKISVTAHNEINNGGAITNAVDPFTDITSPIWTYTDFRLKIDVDTTQKWLSYKLNQKFKLNIYILDENDYRIEMVEVDNNNNPISTHIIDQFVVEKQRSPSKWNLGTNLMVGGGVMATLEPKFKPLGYLSLNFISKGASHLDSDIRVLSLGIGTAGGTISPISYRISNILPLVSDLFVEPLIGISFKGKPLIGIGIASTL